MSTYSGVFLSPSLFFFILASRKAAKRSFRFRAAASKDPTSSVMVHSITFNSNKNDFEILIYSFQEKKFFKTWNFALFKNQNCTGKNET